jgi:hypothetical protein
LSAVVEVVAEAKAAGVVAAGILQIMPHFISVLNTQLL